MVANQSSMIVSEPTALQPVMSTPYVMPRSILSMTGEQYKRVHELCEIIAGSALNIGKNGSSKMAVNDLKIIAFKGLELGLELFAALSSIDLINGTPTLDPQGMLGLINQRGQLEDMTIEGDATQCTVTMKRRGRSPITKTFTLKDAEKLGLVGKDNWKKQPAIMLQWRAVAACARVVFPDVIMGLYTPEELGANVTVDETGHMTATPEPAPQPINFADASKQRRVDTTPQLPAPEPSKPATPPQATPAPVDKPSDVPQSPETAPTQNGNGKSDHEKRVLNQAADLVTLTDVSADNKYTFKTLGGKTVSSWGVDKFKKVGWNVDAWSPAFVPHELAYPIRVKVEEVVNERGTFYYVHEVIGTPTAEQVGK